MRNILIRVKILQAEEKLEEDPLRLGAGERSLLYEVTEEVAAGYAM